jgi:hypothetical protein
MTFLTEACPKCSSLEKRGPKFVRVDIITRTGGTAAKEWLAYQCDCGYTCDEWTTPCDDAVAS